MTIYSTGVLEKMPRSDLEAIYTFCAGANAAPLPSIPEHAVAVLLRLIAQQRQPVPDQPRTVTGERLLLPYRGFVRNPNADLTKAVLRAFQEHPRTIGEVARLLDVEFGSVTRCLLALNRLCGYGIVEHELDGVVTITDKPIPE